MAQENPFATAAEKGIKITLLCSLEIGGTPQNLSLEGTLAPGENHNWLVNVAECVHLEGTCRHAEREAKFSFRLPEPGAGLSVTGMANVLAVEVGEDGAVSRLNVHFGLPTLRALRRHPRYSWKREFTRLGMIFQPDKLPATRSALKAMLRERATQDPRPPLILDIAAGGCRLCMPEDKVQSAFGAANLYVFFFIPSKSAKGSLPFAFIAKRLGKCMQTCPTGMAMRFAFIAEMDWNSTASCHWVNIASEGSSRLNACLGLYAEETFAQG